MQHNNTQPDPVPHHDDARAEALHQTKQGRDTDAKTFAIAAARALKDARCDDILVLDVSGKNPVTDYIVIGTGTSDRQMRSALADVESAAKDCGYHPFDPAKDTSADWLLADYLQVMVHVFEANARALYDLEMLWGDGKRVEWKRETKADTDSNE
ncbi:MAG: ribosome silencing factor [Phycisphaeraceae bacterium]|nr:ribosome silencing factor [Phycisphaerales bacterium]MCB9860740.1 ribosome silencing factor [Phycisphaeraceae bacterium]